LENIQANGNRRRNGHGTGGKRLRKSSGRTELVSEFQRVSFISIDDIGGCPE
jgi:hypothetical protein